MQTFRFLGFKVYNDAKAFHHKIRELCQMFRGNIVVKDQLERASLSIVLNIAEGSAKQSDKDFARYLQISIASVNEVVAGLDIAKDIGIMPKDKFATILVEADNIAKQLGGFIKKLRS